MSIFNTLGTIGFKQRYLQIREYCNELLKQCDRQKWGLFDSVPLYISWRIFRYSMSIDEWTDFNEHDQKPADNESFIIRKNYTIRKMGDGWRGVPLRSRFCSMKIYTTNNIGRYLVPSPDGFWAHWRFIIEKCDSGLLNFRIMDWCDRYHLREYEDCHRKRYKKLYKTGDVVDIFIAVERFQGIILIQKNNKRHASYKYIYKSHDDACACPWAYTYLHCISVWLFRDKDKVKLDFVRWVWNTTPK